jgi:hypothetical protein
MSIDYATILNTVGAFPGVTSLNVTAPSAGDGTPYEKAIIDDWWGRFQDLLNRAGLIPNGAPEVAGSSQHFEALRRCFGAPGEVVLWHGQADPATLGLRLLLMQGQGVLRSAYPDLDAACYIGDVNNPDFLYTAYFRADNPSGTPRNIAGAYLILPDARGCVIRGDDPSATRDPQGATRKFPDIQLKAIQEHGHELITSSSGFAAKVINYNLSAAGNNALECLPGATGDRLRATSVIPSGTVFVDSLESRMINLQAKFCVRF